MGVGLRCLPAARGGRAAGDQKAPLWSHPMARKNAGKPTKGAKRGAKPVRLDLSEETHLKLRIVAAEHGKPMSIFARDVVEKRVNELYGRRD